MQGFSTFVYVFNSTDNLFIWSEDIFFMNSPAICEIKFPGIG